MTIIVRTVNGQPVAAHKVCCQAEVDRQLSQPANGETWTAVELTELP